MLGLTFLFALGDIRVLWAVTSIPFQEAVKRAKTVTDRGKGIQTAFDKAKGDWTSKFEEGKALIVDPTDRAFWPQFLATISSFFPDPEQEYDLDPNAPESQDKLEKLRVHIDAIKPVYRKDVSEWFTGLDPKFKMLMHPVDAKEGAGPTGEGWIVQIVCHHYNSYPDLTNPESRKQLDMPSTDRRKTDFGPIQFLTEKVLPKLNLPELRLFGIHHVSVGWMTTEKEWTTEKGKSSNNLASNTIPLLARASAPAGEGGGEGGGMGGMGGPGGPGGMSQMMASMGQMRGMGGGPGGAGGGMQGMQGMRGMMAGMAGNMGMYGAGGASQADLKKQLKTLSRTDFLIQLVWQPLPPDQRPKTDEERAEMLKKKADELTEAEKNNPAVKVSMADMQKELDAASRKKSEQLDTQVQSALGAATGQPGAPGAPGAAVPGGPVPAGNAPGGAAPKP